MKRIRDQNEASSGLSVLGLASSSTFRNSSVSHRPKITSSALCLGLQDLQTCTTTSRDLQAPSRFTDRFRLHRTEGQTVPKIANFSKFWQDGMISTCILVGVTFFATLTVFLPLHHLKRQNFIPEANFDFGSLWPSWAHTSVRKKHHCINSLFLMLAFCKKKHPWSWLRPIAHHCLV